MMHFELKSLEGTVANCGSCPRAARFRLFRDGVYTYVCYGHAGAAVEALTRLINELRNAE